MPDGIRPAEFLVQGIDFSGKGVMEMRNGGNIPGVTCQGARAETARVIYEIGDDHFDNLKGKLGGRRRVRCGGLWGNTP